MSKHPREEDCRRSDWVSGVPIVLADGQAWHFPRIVARAGPAGQSEWHIIGRGADRQAVMPIIDALRCAAMCEGDGLTREFWMARVAAQRLLANYAVTPSMGVALVHFGFLAAGDWEGLATASEALHALGMETHVSM